MCIPATRFMLQNLPADDTYKHAIDLGCGNGILSIKLAQLNPSLEITCIDESFMAVASAEQNLLDNAGGQLLVIGNRHLGYDVKLKRLFGKSNVSVVAVNKKFVILQATK